MPQAVCVYSSSSDAIAPAFFAVAEELGALIAQRGDTLVFGGTTVGLMGAVARAAHRHGGHVIGVVPEGIRARGIAYDLADELIVTHDLRARKATMEALADIFVGLPGGFGTLEELFEVLTLKQLRTHDKPVVLVNADGFYDPLLQLFEHIFAHRFAHPDFRALFHVTEDAPGVFAYTDTYHAARLPSKWESPGS